MMTRVKIDTYIDLEGEIGSVIKDLKYLKKTYEKEYEKVEIDYVERQWEEGYEYVLIGHRKENAEEKTKRLAKEKEHKEKQEKYELEQLKKLQEKYGKKK